MVEIPSAAITADILAQEVDFSVLGPTSIQYTLAADHERTHLIYMNHFTGSAETCQ